jgi:hypothetical protein
VVVLVASIVFVNALSGDMVRTAYAVKLPPDFVYPVGAGTAQVHVEKAFFASAYGGWHGDGSEMTAYKIRSSDVSALLAGLKAKFPDYRWEEREAAYSPVSYLAQQVPVEFRPAEKARLLLGAPADGVALSEYYFDRRLEVLFVVSHRF